MIIRHRILDAGGSEIARAEAALQAMKYEDRLRRGEYGLFFRDLPDGTQVAMVVVPDEAALARLEGDWRDPSASGQADWGEHSWSVVVAERETLAGLGLNNSPKVRPL